MACFGGVAGDSSVTVLKFSANMTFLFPEDPTIKYQMAKEAGIYIYIQTLYFACKKPSRT